MAFYLWKNWNGDEELYIQNGYAYEHVVESCGDLIVDGPACRYDLIQYGWQEINAEKALEFILKVELVHGFLTMHQKYNLDRIANMILSAV